MAKRGLAVLAVVVAAAFLLLVVGPKVIPGFKLLPQSVFGGAGAEGLTIASVDCGVLTGLTPQQMSSKECVIQAYGTGGGQYLSGTQTLSDTKPAGSVDKSGNLISKPITIELTSYREILSFPVVAQPQTLNYYPISLLDEGGGTFGQAGDSMFTQKDTDPEPACPAGTGVLAGVRTHSSTFGFGATPRDWVKACVGPTPLLTLGYLQPAQPITSDNFKITVGDKVWNTAFDTSKDFSTTTSDGVVRITSPGSLFVSSPPGESDYRALYYKDTGWYIVPEPLYREMWGLQQIWEGKLSTYQRDHPPCFMGGILWVACEGTHAPEYTSPTWEQFPGIVPTALTNYLTDAMNQYYSPMFYKLYSNLGYYQMTDKTGTLLSYSDTGNVASFSGGHIDVEVPRKITSTVFVFYVKADQMGIVAPEAKPKIQNIVYQPSASGLAPVLQATVTNIGSMWASFFPSVSGCSFRLGGQAAAGLPMGLNAGETRTFPIELDAGLLTPGTSQTCTFTVANGNNAALSDSATFTGTITAPPPQCYEGSWDRSGSTILQCRSGKMVQVASCTSPYDITPKDDGSLFCQTVTPTPAPVITPTPPTPPQECRKSDILCQLPALLMKNLLWILGVIGVIAVAGALFRAKSPLAGPVLVGGLAVIVALIFAAWLLGQWWFYLLLIVGVVVYARGKLR